MAKYDSMLIGYAVNQKSGGYDGKEYSFLDTSDAKYLYNNCFLDTYCAEPMAFEQLAAEAEAKGFSVNVQDGLIMGYTKEQLIDVLKDTDCLLYGFSIYESTESDLFEVITWLKATKPNTKIYVGGPYATIAVAHILNSCPAIDYIMVGDGDESFPQLIDCIKNNKDIKDVVNLYYHDSNGNIVSNEVRCVDLNILHHPKRIYTDFIEKKGYAYSLSSARGCGYANCTFCYLKQYQKVGNQPKFRYKSPKYVADEIEELIDKYGIDRLSFTDEDFFGDRAGVERALELFKILIDRNIKINLHANARVKTVMWLARNNYLNLCSQAGIKYMYVGLESYNDKSLKLFDKGITTKDIDFVVDELAKHKIRINPGLITFDPTLTLDNVKDNIELYKRINYYDAFIFTRRLVLYPNASPKIQELFKNEDYFQHEDVEKLFDAMVKYRDSVFPYFIQLNRKIATDEVVQQIQNFHFSSFDSIYQALKENNPNYGEIVDDNIEKTNIYVRRLLKKL